MSEQRFQHARMTCSSVTSTVSTASSGYAIVSGPRRQRGDVREIYLPDVQEPPPDYDETPGPHQVVQHEMNPNNSFDSQAPLMKQLSIPVQEDTRNQIMIRINSQSQDVNIEILSTASHSPKPLIASRSSESPEVFTNLLHGATKTGTKRKFHKTCTKKEKILIGIVTVVLLALVLVVLNFTVCIGGFTTSCK